MCDILQNDIDEFVQQWNRHRIRQSRADCIGGIPEDLYDMPQTHGTQTNHRMTTSLIIFTPVGAQDYLKEIDANVWLQAMLTESKDQPLFYPLWFEHLLLYCTNRGGWPRMISL